MSTYFPELEDRIDPWEEDSTEETLSGEELDQIRDHFELVLEAIYDSKHTMEDLDNSLMYVASYLGVKICKEKKMKIERKKNPYFNVGVSMMSS